MVLEIKDHRRILLGPDALLDAVLAFDREQNGWLWSAHSHELLVDPNGQGVIRVTAKRPGSDQGETVERSPSWVASAIVNYFYRAKIPIPRRGIKRLQPDGAGLVFVIENSVRCAPIFGVAKPSMVLDGANKEMIRCEGG